MTPRYLQFGKSRVALAVIALNSCAPADLAEVQGAFAADSGVFIDNESRSFWTSVVVNDKVVEIRERIVLYEENRGFRRYSFDSTGTLRTFSERVWRASSGEGTIHRESGLRESTIEFAAGSAVLYSRSYAGRSLRYSRFELTKIQSRAYALLDSARMNRR